jgi:general secretion pathway protein G
MIKIYREYIRNAKKQSVMRKGMTLIEIMIVLVIMASVMTLVGVNVFGALDTGNEKTTTIQLQQFKSAIESFKLNYRRMPNSLDELINTPDKRSLIDSDTVPKDGWDNEFTFEKNGNRIKIYSNGADGMPNTEDDIVVNVG